MGALCTITALLVTRGKSLPLLFDPYAAALSPERLIEFSKRQNIMKNPIGKRGIIGVILLIGGIGVYVTAQSSAVKELAQLEHDTGDQHGWSDIEGMIGVQTKNNQNSGMTSAIIGVALMGWGLKKHRFGSTDTTEEDVAEKPESE